jgi:hypothetical protein
MNMSNNTELSADELDIISGGLSCDAARAVGDLYLTLGKFIIENGEPAQGAVSGSYLIGIGQGIRQASCPA